MGNIDWNEHYTSSFLYNNLRFHSEIEDGAIAHFRWYNKPQKKK